MQDHPVENGFYLPALRVLAKSGFPIFKKMMDGPALPMAQGISQQMMESVGEERWLEKFDEYNMAFSMLVRSWSYREALAKDGSKRHDLNGEPVEDVAEEHRQWARVSLERRPKLKRGNPTTRDLLQPPPGPVTQPALQATPRVTVHVESQPKKPKAAPMSFTRGNGAAKLGDVWPKGARQ